MVNHVGSRIESLPESVLAKLCTRLRLKDLKGLSSRTRHHRCILLGGERREHFLEVVANRLSRISARGKELSHLLVGAHLRLSNTKSLLDHIGIKLGAMVETNHEIVLTSKRKRQRVIADDSHGSETDINAATVLMGIREKQIGIYLVATEDLEGILDLRKSPDVLALLERTSSVHLHIAFHDEVIEELKRLMVLARIPVVGDHRQNRLVRRANKRLLTSSNLFLANLDVGGNLINGPIKTRLDEHLLRGQIIVDRNTKTVPRGFAGVSHSLNFMCHCVLPFSVVSII